MLHAASHGVSLQAPKCGLPRHRTGPKPGLSISAVAGAQITWVRGSLQAVFPTAG
jgi:hypothetical protein